MSEGKSRLEFRKNLPPDKGKGRSRDILRGVATTEGFGENLPSNKGEGRSRDILRGVATTEGFGENLPSNKGKGRSRDILRGVATTEKKPLSDITNRQTAHTSGTDSSDQGDNIVERPEEQISGIYEVLKNTRQNDTLQNPGIESGTAEETQHTFSKALHDGIDEQKKRDKRYNRQELLYRALQDSTTSLGQAVEGVLTGEGQGIEAATGS
jgi:hypothetical protein